MKIYNLKGGPIFGGLTLAGFIIQFTLRPLGTEIAININAGQIIPAIQFRRDML